MEPTGSGSSTAAPEGLPGTASVAKGRLVLSGDWTLAWYARLRTQLQALDGQRPSPERIDWSGLGRIDTAGASLLAELIGPGRLATAIRTGTGLRPETSALLLAVAEALEGRPEPTPTRHSAVVLFLAHAGERVEAIGRLVWTLIGFIGQTLSVLGWTLIRPARWRFTPFIATVHDIGLNALPIVALLTFLVGAVVAFLGATVLDDFGATIYTVNLVAFSFLREFGVLLAAILVAGRTASSFTAHIGAMQVNQEIDAIRTLGLNPIEILVLPRLLAMFVSLPILTFVGMISGLVGGALVCWLSLDISVTQFVSIVERDIAVRHFLVGLSKAPIFALLIALIGCLEGFKVSGSAQSVGEHTTSSVVQSIFTVILLDAIAALFFMEMGW